MRKLLLAVTAICASSFSLYAQPQLTRAQDFEPGNRHIMLSAVNPEKVAPGQGGANVTWDFSSLVSDQDTFVQDIVLPSETPYASDYPSAELVERNNDSSYIFLDKDQDGLAIAGYIHTISDIKIKYSDPSHFINTTITYLDSFSDASQRSYTIQGQDYKGSGMIYTIADGYGTLKLPGGLTYDNVLRIRFEQYHKDSAFGPAETNNTITYAWYDAAHRTALLKIDSTYISSPFFTGTYESVKWLLHEHTSGMAPAPVAQEINADFVNGQLIINSHLPQASAYDIAIYDMNGKLMKAQNSVYLGNGSTRIEASGLSAGVYVLHCSAANNAAYLLKPTKILVTK